MNMYFMGLDLGQKRDYSAVAVVERIGRILTVRYAERLPLGTSYPRVVERVRAIVQSGPLRGDCALAVDATGVGAPVVDMLRAARLGCDLSAVVITGGDRASGNSVPKRDLMGELLVLLEQGQLKIGNLREGSRLVKELMDVRESGGRLGADGSGEHDDLAIALALACWRAKRREFCGEVGRRLI
jgi:hypothetical protein